MKLKCPVCGHASKVIDSRPADENASIRRRRECLNPACQKRFTTCETIESVQPIVLKKNGLREVFDKNKLLVGILKATQKRPVDAKAVTDEIEAELYNSMRTEVTSNELGEMVMDKLRVLDAVAYVRFASVHREFKDVETFMQELEKIKNK